MSFDAGDIQARATLDTRPFMASAARVRAEGRKLARERWNARVGIDPTQAEAETDRFKARLKTKLAAPTSARITADTTEALLKIKPLTDKLDEIQRKVATARVRLDGNEQARRQLDQLDFQLRRVGLITSRPRVSLGGIVAANLRLDELAAKLAVVGASRTSPGGGGGGGILGSLSSLGGHAPGGLGLAIGAGLPLVAPVAGLAAGAASSLLTPTAAAGIGGGLFAKTAASTYQQVGADLKNLLALQKRYNAATSDKTRLAALQAEKKAWGDLSPAEQKAVTELHQLHDDWTKFQKDLHPQTFKLLSSGLDIARKGLHLLEPDVVAAGKAIDTMAGRADKALSSPYWQHFFGDFLPGQTHRALMTLFTDLGNVGTGLAHLTEDFAPLGQDLERASVRWTKQFAKWTEGDGPGKFVNWVEQHGPTAAHDLEDMGRGIGGILKALAPLGELELSAFGPILKFVGNMAQQHPKEVEALGAAYLVVAGGLKAISAVSGIAGTAKAVGALFAALRAGKGLSGVGGVLKGGSGMGGCCCGPGGTPTPGAPGPSGEGENPSIGTRIAGYGRKAAPYVGAATIPTAAVAAGAIGLTLGADWVGSFKRALDQVLGPQSGYQRQVNAAAAAKVAATGVNPHSARGIYQTAQYVQHFGGRTGFAQGFTPSAPTPAQLEAIKQEAAAYGGLTSNLRATGKALAPIITNTRSVRIQFGTLADVADRVGSKSLNGISSSARANRQTLRDAAGTLKDYKQQLLDTGMPLDQVKKKVDAAASSLVHQATKVYGDKAAVDKLLGSLHALPKQITSNIKVHTTGDKASEAALRRLLGLRQQLAGDVVIHTVTASTAGKVGSYLGKKATGGYIAGPGSATSDSIPARLSNGEFVLRASAVQHFGVDALEEMNRYADGGPVIPPWLQAGQNPSANATSSGSSSSSKSGSGSRSGRSSISSKPPSKQATANVIAGIVDMAGLTFLDDLKSTEHAIRSGIRQMINRLDNAVRDRYLQSDKSLVKQLRGTRGILVALAQQETIVAKALSNAQQTLSNVRSQASSVRSGALSAYQGLGDTSQLTNVTSVQGILDVEGQQAKVARAFTKNLSLLRKKGLSKEQYQELLAAGPGGAGNVVGLLAHATPAQIRQLNRDTKFFTSQGKTVGSASADFLYGRQIRSAQSEVKRDRRVQHDLIHSQRHIADALEKYLAAGLQDHGTHKRLDDLNKALSSLPRDVAHAIAGALDGKSKAAASHHRSRPSRSNS